MKKYPNHHDPWRAYSPVMTKIPKKKEKNGRNIYPVEDWLDRLLKHKFTKKARLLRASGFFMFIKNLYFRYLFEMLVNSGYIKVIESIKSLCYNVAYVLCRHYIQLESVPRLQDNQDRFCIFGRV